MKLAEFIGPLSMTSCTTNDQWEEYKKFTDFITGDEKRRKDIAAALNPDEDGGGAKGGKKKGKKKK